MLEHDPDHPMPPPLLLTIPQAVKYSGLSRSEIYLRLNSGELKAKKNRRTTLVVRESLEKLVKNLPNF